MNYSTSASLGAVTLAFALSAVSASAATSLATGDFDPSAVTFDFDTLPTGDINGTDLGDFTVTGSSRIFDGSAWGGSSDPGRRSVVTRGMEIAFDDAISQVGFNFGGNTTNSVSLSFYSGATLIDTASLNSNASTANWLFNGFETAGTFDRLVFSPESSSNWFYGMYDLK